MLQPAPQQVGRHQEFRSAFIGLGIIQSDFPFPAPRFGRMVQHDVRKFVTEREALAAAMMSAVNADELLAYAHKGGKLIVDKR